MQWTPVRYLGGLDTFLSILLFQEYAASSALKVTVPDAPHEKQNTLYLASPQPSLCVITTSGATFPQNGQGLSLAGMVGVLRFLSLDVLDKTCKFALYLLQPFLQVLYGGFVKPGRRIG